MAKKTPPSLLLLLLLTLSFLGCFLPCSCNCKLTQKHETKIKGMFVFGSSLVDNGNNNFLKDSMAKADYSPYGIDFPLGPSGRFTNGKNVIDLLGDYLKLPCYIPAFTHPTTRGSMIINGVNYASGGSGILDDTGSLTGRVMSLNEQIRKFKEVSLPDLELQVGCKSRELLPQYLFVVGSGGNDYSLNYFLTKVNSNVSLQVFTANLTSTLSHQLKRLYNLGARKFVLMSVNPIGCSPVVRGSRPMRKGCIQSMNRAAHLFNSHLKSLVINPQMPASNLIFVNSYKFITDILKDPASKGFSDTSNGCCEVDGSGILCKREGSTCSNRSSHVFFDGLHPTEAVNVVIATLAYSSNLKTEVYPINVNQLAQI